MKHTPFIQTSFRILSQDGREIRKARPEVIHVDGYIEVDDGKLVRQFPFHTFTESFFELLQFYLQQTAEGSLTAVDGSIADLNQSTTFIISGTNPFDGVVVGYTTNPSATGTPVPYSINSGLKTDFDVAGLQANATTIEVTSDSIIFTRTYTNRAISNPIYIKQVGLASKHPASNKYVLWAKDSKAKDLTNLSIMVAPQSSVEIKYVFTTTSSATANGRLTDFNFNPFIAKIISGNNYSVVDITGASLTTPFMSNRSTASLLGLADSSPQFGLMIAADTSMNAADYKVGQSGGDYSSTSVSFGANQISGQIYGNKAPGGTMPFSRDGVTINGLNVGQIIVTRQFTALQNINVGVGGLYMKGVTNPIMLAKVVWEGAPISVSTNQIFEGKIAIGIPFDVF